MQKLDKFLSLLGIFQKTRFHGPWPGCFRAGAASTLLVEAAHKLTFGQPQEVQTPHQVQGIPRLNTTTGYLKAVLLTPHCAPSLPRANPQNLPQARPGYTYA